MTQLKITINMDNTAFCPNWEGEVTRILDECSSALANGEMFLDQNNSIKLRDHNGNVVGKLEIEED